MSKSPEKSITDDDVTSLVEEAEAEALDALEEAAEEAVPGPKPAVSTRRAAGMSAPAKAAKARLEERVYRSILPGEWEQIRVLWEFGLTTMDDLSAKYGCTKETLRRKFRKEGWARGRRAGEIGEATEAEIKGEAKKNIERIGKMREQFLKYSNTLAVLAMQEVAEAARSSTPVSTKKDNLIALQKAASIISTVRDEQYHLFGLYKDENLDEEMPEIGISEYSAEEIAEMQRSLEEMTTGALTSTDSDGIPFEDDDE